MLNLESVLTALLAWVVFKENADRRIVIGMLAIVAGGVVLSWPQEAVSAQDWTGPLAVAFACLCWAIDNNLTRKVSASDALFIAGSKGLVAGVVMFVLALRGLGSARTGAYFSTAPFLGAAISILLLGESVSLMFLLAAALMAVGVWIHLMENHAHEHQHELLEHEHRHTHDEHHQHTHWFEWDGKEPHSHPHVHTPMRHRHAHFPDVHHRHEH
jgi:drug/metabolite transporter (DMT)-like permease